MILKDVKFCLRSFIRNSIYITERFGGGKRSKSSEFHLFLNTIKLPEKHRHFNFEISFCKDITEIYYCFLISIMHP